jgi:putative ABC transport system substrate-binding protein
MFDMKRRDLITLLGGAAVTWPLAARAQQPAKPVIGFLNAAWPHEARLRGLREGLKEHGYVEGENLAIEYRWAENQLDRLPVVAAELVRRQVTVIFATGRSAPALAAKAATEIIPIVFAVPEDPLRAALVDSLSRPGGNATGIYFFVADLVAKQLGLLRELVPGAARVAVLVNPVAAARAESTVKEAEAAAGALGLQVQIFNVGTRHEINAAFEALARERPAALFVGPDPFFTNRRVQLANLAARHAIPTICVSRDLPEVGALMSYGTNINDAYRQAGVYIGRILKGAKPADLPVVQSTSRHQRADRNNARPRRASVAARPRRRGDRMMGRAAMVWPRNGHGPRGACTVPDSPQLGGRRGAIATRYSKQFRPPH